MTHSRLPRTGAAFLSLVAAVALTSACGGGSDSGSADALDVPGADALDKATGVTTITSGTA